MNKDEFQFNNEKDAIQLLENSRKTIDKLDQEIFKLILKRTMLAKDIVSAKIFLGKNIHDEEREKFIYDNIKKVAIEENINEDIILKIMKLLTELSKEFQKNIKK